MVRCMCAHTREDARQRDGESLQFTGERQRVCRRERKRAKERKESRQQPRNARSLRMRQRAPECKSDSVLCTSDILTTATTAPAPASFPVPDSLPSLS